MRSRATVQSASGYLRGRNASTRDAVRQALQDSGYRYRIHEDETTAGLVEEDLTFGYDFLDVRRYGAVYDAATDDTTAHLTAMEVAYVSGGIVELPAGVTRITSLVFTWAAAITVSLRGRGKKATFLQKLNDGVTDADPVLNLTNGVGVLDTYSALTGFSVVGDDEGHDGIKLTNIARVVVSDVLVRECATGINNSGSLIFECHDTSLLSNLSGYKSRKANGIYCNLVQFFGGEIRANSALGLDIGDTNGFFAYGVDLEVNGTADDLATGALRTRDTCDDETGYGQMGFFGCWFEGNLGTNIHAESCQGLNITFVGCPLINSEDGRAMIINAVQTASLDNIVAASAADVVYLAAGSTTIRNSTIYAVTQFSNFYEHRHLTTGAGFTAHSTNRLASATGLPMPEGANGRMGTAVLVGGTVTVANTSVTANTRVFVLSQADGGAPGWLRCVGKVAGVSFTINSSSATDTSTVAYLLVEPA